MKFFRAILPLIILLTGCISVNSTSQPTEGVSPSAIPEQTTASPTSTVMLSDTPTPTLPSASATPMPTSTISSQITNIGGILIYTDHESIYALDLGNEHDDLVVERVEGLYHFMGGPSRIGSVYITYSGDTSNNTGEIYELKLQAKSLTRITRDEYADYYLAMSPDGLQLAYISDWFDSPDTGKRYKLQVLDTKSNTVQSVAESANQLGIPSWSPDSKTIAFRELSNDNNYLCIVDVSSRKLTKYTIDFIDLTWSPDGTQLGVSTRGEQFSGIYILDAMTGNIEKELRTTNVPFRIAWSPIEDKLVFQSRIYLGNDRYDKKTSLDLLDIETGSITTLHDGGVDGSTDEYHFLWSKDGKYIAYFIEPRQVVIWSVEANRVVESLPISGYGIPADAVWIFSRILFQVDGKYLITAEGDNLNLRDGPALSAQTLKRLLAGDLVTIVDGPQYSDGYTWWKFKSEDNVIGWAVENSEWYEPIK